MSEQVANTTEHGMVDRWQADEPAAQTRGRASTLDELATRLSEVKSNSPARRAELLTQVIDLQVIPRIVSSLETNDMRTPSATDDSREVIELAALVMAGNGEAASSFLDDIQSQGVSIDSLYLDLLAPAARRLGELWTADLCDFTQVTTGLWRLQRLMHDLSPAFQAQLERRAHGRWALLAPVPGDQHSFGIFMVAEFFRRDGWNVRSGPVESLSELARIVRTEWFSVAGFSAGSEMTTESLAACVRTIRAASCNPAIKVLVGGPVFTGRNDLVSRVGADATALDGPDAVRKADALLARQALTHG